MKSRMDDGLVIWMKVLVLFLFCFVSFCSFLHFALVDWLTGVLARRFILNRNSYANCFAFVPLFIGLLCKFACISDLSALVYAPIRLASHIYLCCSFVACTLGNKTL